MQFKYQGFKKGCSQKQAGNISVICGLMDYLLSSQDRSYIYFALPCAVLESRGEGVLRVRPLGNQNQMKHIKITCTSVSLLGEDLTFHIFSTENLESIELTRHWGSQRYFDLFIKTVKHHPHSVLK